MKTKKREGEGPVLYFLLSISSLSLSSQGKKDRRFPQSSMPVSVHSLASAILLHKNIMLMVYSFYRTSFFLSFPVLRSEFFLFAKQIFFSFLNRLFLRQPPKGNGGCASV